MSGLTTAPKQRNIIALLRRCEEMFLAAEAGIFVPSGTQAGKVGMKLKNDEIAPEALSA